MYIFHISYVYQYIFKYFMEGIASSRQRSVIKHKGENRF